MKAKEVWVIVPFSRPQHLQNVLNNFKRQNFFNKRLIIVENGAAVGTCKMNGIEPDLLLTSEAHQSSAKNAGIDALRERGGGFWVTYDDDDYYGPEYLSEMAMHSGRAEILGKGDFFVRMADGTLRCFEGIGCLEYTNFVHGPTICSWAELCTSFPNTGVIGEDCAFVSDMIEMGAEVFATSKHNFIFYRYPDKEHHTWKITDRSLTQSLAFGVGPRGGSIVKDYGTEIDFDFVNGVGEEPPFKLISTEENDFEMIKEARERGISFRDYTQQILEQVGLIMPGEDPYEKLSHHATNSVMWNSFKDGLHVENIDDLAAQQSDMDSEKRS